MAEAPPTLSPVSPARHRPRVWLPVLLFVATAATTFLNGACEFRPYELITGLESQSPMVPIWGGDSFQPIRRSILKYWGNGVIYSVALLSILFAHEMGHYLVTIFYRIPCSLPHFLPMPFFPPVFLPGTLGAVISMDGRRADRVQIFDIGIAGPIAGLIIAVPVMWVGVVQLDAAAPIAAGVQLESPLLVRWMMQWAGQEAGPVHVAHLLHNPLFLAGWVGMLITGLNMLPVSQLDGGHVIHSLFGARARYVARGFILLAITYMIVSMRGQWLLMLILVMLLGPDHPPTRNDDMDIGMFRKALGLASLAIPLLCFPPQAFIIPD